MDRLNVRLGEDSYPIYIGSGLLKKAGKLAGKSARGRLACIVTNPRVDRLYGGSCRESFKKAGFSVATIVIPDGERYKTLENIKKIYNGLIKNRFDRAAMIVALGGGVVGDMAGFAAATYMRGIDYIQIPTTLLAQVDSSVGGKTGVDYPGGKNIIGAFYQPKLVLADSSVISTLPEREYRCGIAEVIKYGIIRSASLFSYLEKSVQKIRVREAKSLREIVNRSCRIKARVVSQDEKESGVRAILNLGHTFGHAIETALNFQKLKHGEAVAIGLVQAARLSYTLGFVNSATVRRIKTLVSEFGLPTGLPRQLTPGDVLKGMRHDKKMISGKARFILFDKIGTAKIVSGLRDKEILSAIE